MDANFADLTCFCKSKKMNQVEIGDVIMLAVFVHMLIQRDLSTACLPPTWLL